jgi:hypothetical protein
MEMLAEYQEILFLNSVYFKSIKFKMFFPTGDNKKIVIIIKKSGEEI